MVEEIKSDMGGDVLSLGITDNTIKIKINEAIRKISSYAPYIRTETYDISGNSLELDKTTCMVSHVYSDKSPSGAVNRESPIYDEADLFNASRYVYNFGGLNDPYIHMMNITEMQTLQNMVALKDWHFDKDSHTLYLSNFSGTSITVRSLQKYESLTQIKDADVIQTVKEYAVALCKIAEGTIRRKLQNAPGAIQMDGDALVSEGTSEKTRLDEQIPKMYSYLRFGLRA
jgi:hypothetical protein